MALSLARKRGGATPSILHGASPSFGVIKNSDNVFFRRASGLAVALKGRLVYVYVVYFDVTYTCLSPSDHRSSIKDLKCQRQQLLTKFNP